MKRNIRILWKKALRGDSDAYRELGIMLLLGKGCKRDWELAGLCLEKSMDLGNQESYFLYHKAFSRGKQVIDDASYEEIYCDYLGEKDPVKKKELERYLRLGTERQMKKIGIAHPGVEK